MQASLPCLDSYGTLTFDLLYAMIVEVCKKLFLTFFRHLVRKSVLTIVEICYVMFKATTVKLLNL